jgi:hypothetical protein
MSQEMRPVEPDIDSTSKNAGRDHQTQEHRGVSIRQQGMITSRDEMRMALLSIYCRIQERECVSLLFLPEDFAADLFRTNQSTLTGEHFRLHSYPFLSATLTFGKFFVSCRPLCDL